MSEGTCATVQIETPAGPVIINESDFVEGMVLVGATQTVAVKTEKSKPVQIETPVAQPWAQAQ